MPTSEIGRTEYFIILRCWHKVFIFEVLEYQKRTSILQALFE